MYGSMVAICKVTRPWRCIYRDMEIPRPNYRDIEIRGIKYYGIKKWRQLSHDIVILRHIFTDQKATASGFQDSKTLTSRFED